MFAADPSLAIAAQKPSAKVSSTIKHREQKKIYLRRSSIVQLSLDNLAIWKKGTLRTITALHMNDRGMFIYSKELGKLLAKVHRASEWPEPVRHQRGKKHLKKVWECKECGYGFEDQDDLYDHICKEQKLD